MTFDNIYPLSVGADWPHDYLLHVLQLLAARGYQRVTLVLPENVGSLRTLDDFYSLRKTRRELNLKVTISGGTKTMRGLARLLGFPVIEPYEEDGTPAAEAEWSEHSGPAQNTDTGVLLALATIKALLISKGVFNEEEYQQMLDFVEQQWKARPG
jgi:hypothetical protein